MRKPKERVEWRLVVHDVDGKTRTYAKKSEALAVKDVAWYDDAPLGRTAHVESRTVTETPWAEV